MAERDFDIAIIGGGPAGLSAAIWSARYLHSVCVIDSGDPRNWETRGINGYLGLDDVRPAQLRGKGRETCRTLGAALIDEVVLRVERRSDEDFLMCLEGGDRVTSRRVLLAIGIRDVWPDIPGLQGAYGVNAHVCPDCDGYDARDKKVIVIGNGRRALGMALNLTTWTREIIICTNGRPADLDEPDLARTIVETVFQVRERELSLIAGALRLESDYPAHWQRDLTRYRDTLLANLRRPEFFLPVELNRDQSVGRRYRAIRRFLRMSSASLAAWPTLWEETRRRARVV